MHGEAVHSRFREQAIVILIVCSKYAAQLLYPIRVLAGSGAPGGGGGVPRGHSPCSVTVMRLCCLRRAAARAVCVCRTSASRLTWPRSQRWGPVRCCSRCLCWHKIVCVYVGTRVCTGVPAVLVGVALYVSVFV